MESTKHLADVAAQHLGQVPTRECFSHRVQVFHLPMPVGGDDAIANAVQRHLRIFFFTEERFFVALAFRDIELHGHQAAERTTSI